MLDARWRKLERDIFQRKKASFDISKVLLPTVVNSIPGSTSPIPITPTSQVPDIYDCAKYDLAHNFEALGKPQPLIDVHEHVRLLASLVVPLEYGSTLKVQRARTCSEARCSPLK